MTTYRYQTLLRGVGPVVGVGNLRAGSLTVQRLRGGRWVVVHCTALGTHSHVGPTYTYEGSADRLARLLAERFDQAPSRLGDDVRITEALIAYDEADLRLACGVQVAGRERCLVRLDEAQERGYYRLLIEPHEAMMIIRRCQTLYTCQICGNSITLGDRYYDGGYPRRAHVACAEGPKLDRSVRLTQQETCSKGDTYMTTSNHQANKARDWKRYRIRTCMTLHTCQICGNSITLGDRYYDGGYPRRAHVLCAEGPKLDRT